MKRHVVNQQSADVNLTAGVLNIYPNQSTVFGKIQYNSIRHFIALYTWSFSQMGSGTLFSYLLIFLEPRSDLLGHDLSK